MNITDLICHTGHWHECSVCGDSFTCHCSDQSRLEMCGGDKCDDIDEDCVDEAAIDSYNDNEVERLRLEG